MRRVLPTLILLSALGCMEDYDVEEVAPHEHLETEACDHHHDHEHDHHDDHQDAEVHTGIEDGPSGHSHGAGERNHGTGWFFNQPWAAPFIWGKLLRDAGVFLVLAAAIFMATGKRGRKR